MNKNSTPHCLHALLEKCCHYKDQIKTLEDKQRTWPLPLTMHLPLVGRQKELSQLKKAFFKGGIALLRGGLGTGKTRLMQELFFELETINFFVAPSFEIEKSLPYAPIIYGLRHHISKEIWKEIDPIWAYQLQRLLPELNQHQRRFPKPKLYLNSHLENRTSLKHYSNCFNWLSPRKEGYYSSWMMLIGRIHKPFRRYLI